MHCAMQRQNATVTVVHSHSPNPAEITREADIVVAAVGKAELVRGDWLKPGAVVIDVGINSVEVCTLLFSYLFKISA
jgi:5,10-methylene-tetrahydrofolate dehydrogenase/methenyl tetrahydrofolate cyclohydrolase